MSNIYDLVILGGGAAGLTAGMHALRAGLKTVLIERLMLGGQIINADIIENYPGVPTGITGPDLATALQEQASDLSIEYAFGSAVSLEKDDGALVVGTETETQLLKLTKLDATMTRKELHEVIKKIEGNVQE